MKGTMRSPLRVAVVKAIHQVSWWTGLSEQLARRRRGGRVLLLHGIGDANYPTTEFRLHLVFLRERYRIVSLDGLLTAAVSGSGDADGMVALTFDDGLRNYLVDAFPLLQEFQLPATFFVCPALIESGGWLWNHDCRERLRSLSPSECAGFLSELGVPATSPDVVVEWMKGIPEERRAACHEAIRERTRAFRPSEGQHQAFDLMRWEDLRSLPADLISIGSHGTEHRVITKVDDAVLMHEVEQSRDWLVRKLGRAVEFFSYPNGRLDDRVVEQVRRLYRAAWTMEPGFVLDPGDLHRLPRIGVPQRQASLTWRLHSPGWAGGQE